MMMLIKGLVSTLPAFIKVKENQSLTTNYYQKQNTQKQHKVCFLSLLPLGKDLFFTCCNHDWLFLPLSWRT